MDFCLHIETEKRTTQFQSQKGTKEKARLVVVCLRFSGRVSPGVPSGGEGSGLLYDEEESEAERQ